MAFGSLPSGIGFSGAWHPYQAQALEAFEAGRAAGRTRTHLTAPPGAGKTMMGWECIVRLGRPALVLAPTATVQGQWPQYARWFYPDPSSLAACGIGAPVSCLTYQALCQLDDPESGLRQMALTRVAAQRAAQLGVDEHQAAEELAGWSGAAARRLDGQLRGQVRAIKREIARGAGHVNLAALLSPAVRERIQTLKDSGVGTVVLDECHHLASMWGYVVEAVLEQLGPVHVIALTATPPRDLTGDEARLYERLLGPIDFHVPTPAVVREGKLAPYQELAYLCEPEMTERRWLDERHARFERFVAELAASDDDGELPTLTGWVRTRMSSRTRGADLQGPQLSWPAFTGAYPDLARAGVRYLRQAGLTIGDAPHHEGFREALDMADWICLLGDYITRCLHAHPSERAQERTAQIAAGLADLGYGVSSRGIRATASEVDRVLMTSAAKLTALAEIVEAERAGRGAALRAVVLCDNEGRSGALEADATNVTAVLSSCVEQRGSDQRPLAVTGQSVRCALADVPALTAALAELPDLPPGVTWSAEPLTGGVAELRASGMPWTSRQWVPLTTALLSAGHTRLLIGTRALLGEGWNCPEVNCLVDLTCAATSVTVQQMRGRSLRLDPDDPGKVASNWDVVCVASDLAKGQADYRRFVRRHEHIHAPAEDGAIERGVSHVHPALSPASAPAAEQIDQVTTSCLRRAAGHQRVLDRWAVGSAYRGVELAALLIGGGHGHEHVASGPVTRPAPPRAQPGQAGFEAGLLGLGGVLAGAAGTAALVAGAVTLGAAAPVGALLCGAGWLMGRRELRQLQVDFPDRLCLLRACFTVIDALVELGELSGAAAASLQISARADGYVRVTLTGADAEEAQRFCDALDDALAVRGDERLLISRPVLGGEMDGRSAVRRLMLGGRPLTQARWDAVPRAFARSRRRAGAYANAHRTWHGAGELVDVDEPAGSRALERALAGAGAPPVTQRRTVWE